MVEYVFMELEFASEKRLMLVFELFVGIVPRTCENFLTLCKGVDIKGKHISYRNSIISRIVARGTPHYSIDR
jgi:cyclophilin family peptidyl-prolyl cis-trans isomerase